MEENIVLNSYKCYFLTLGFKDMLPDFSWENIPVKSVCKKIIDIIIHSRGRSRTAVTSKMEHFVIIVNAWKPLSIITKSSILAVAAVLDRPLDSKLNSKSHRKVSVKQLIKNETHFGENQNTQQLFIGDFGKFIHKIPSNILS